MTVPADSTTILLQQVLGQQAQIAADVSATRAEVGKAITRLEVMDTWRQASEATRADHESRIRALERFRYTLAGLAMVGGAASGAVGAWAGYILGHH